MWLREMEVLICVSDHIVEFIPSSQTFPDGSKLEVLVLLFSIFSSYLYRNSSEIFCILSSEAFIAERNQRF